ncbi:MAG: adenylate/guanylate cyclase domain-containing protein [Nitrospirales bacterium]|nr:MAG: adenylate/guanylate cyclase domain-containing protein [Nitrospirales bacterium]
MSNVNQQCPKCDCDIPLEFHFCGNCGTPLIPDRPTSFQEIDTRQQGTILPIRSDLGLQFRKSTPEIRHLTVMFCDLVGSTTLSEHMSPEDLRFLLIHYEEYCEEIIQRYEGYVAKLLGDGLLIYFGYPLAHEDDCHRAVQTSLTLLAEMDRLHERLKEHINGRLSIRTGIHVGQVVMGQMSNRDDREVVAIGSTTNIAARLQTLAAPDTVIISESVFRMIKGGFECQSLGYQTLKGLTQPISVYQVLHASTVQNRFETAVGSNLYPLVGRDREMSQLLTRWETTKDGNGQAILLTGEPGIGKSRVVKSFKEHVAQEPHIQLECQCYPLTQNSSLDPIIDLVQRYFDLRREDTPLEKTQKLEAVLKQYPLPVDEVLPLFASLLSIPLTQAYPGPMSTPQRQKEKTLEALLGLLMYLTQKHPVLFIIEDIQWADPSTLGFFGLLMERLPTAQLLLLFTARSSMTLPLVQASSMIVVPVARLSHHQITQIIEHIAGSIKLTDAIVRQLVAKADGVPLYAEELTKMVLESNIRADGQPSQQAAGPFPSLAIPNTLHPSLLARLDQMPQLAELVQMAATFGREFTYDMLKIVSGLESATLQRDLQQLVEADLLCQEVHSPNAPYMFKHALIQEEAYQTMIRSTRQRYHLAIAKMLDQQFPEILETQPELMAHHYTHGGVDDRAVYCWRLAGKRAIQRSANIEAISHFHKGLELLKTAPDTLQRTQQEIDLLILQGTAQIAVKGYASSEVKDFFERAQQLCELVEERNQLFPAVHGLWSFFLVRGQLTTALELGQKLYRLAQDHQDNNLILESHFCLGLSLTFLGDLLGAQEHLNTGATLYRPLDQDSLAFRFGQDPVVGCLAQSSWPFWILGYPDQAQRRVNEAFSLAQTLGHPHSLAFSLHYLTHFYLFSGNYQAALETAEAEITLSKEQGFPFWLNMAMMLKGGALVELGGVELGLEGMRQGLRNHLSLGAAISRTYWMSLLAHGLGRAGRGKEGLGVIEEALTLREESGEAWWEAELYRLRGQLLLNLNEGTLQTLRRKFRRALTAEECFDHAVTLARNRQQKSLELRALISLVQFQRQQGQTVSALASLQEVYQWFSEGFETADLQTAKALLESIP